MRMYTLELWNQVNDENKAILDDYVMELESQGKSDKTIYQYKADIRGFLCWAVKHKITNSILDLKRRDFRRFFLEMSKDGLSGNRINRMQSSIRNMLNYCWLDDDIYEDYESNAMAKIKGVPHEPVREIIFYSNSDINAMLDYFMRHEKYQLALCLSLTYDNGARRNEIYQVSKKDFDKKQVTNEVIGKRGKKFKLMYSKRTQKIAHIYLQQRGEDDVDSLWVKNENGEKVKVSYDALYNWGVIFRRTLFHTTGRKTKGNFHSIRHSAAQAYSDGTHYMLSEIGKGKLDINMIKTILHHSNISTSQGYLKNTDNEQFEDTFGIDMGD